MNGSTTNAFNDLIALDPGASWDAATNSIQGSCAPACAPISPRLVLIALFDVDLYQLMRATNNWGACPGGNRCVRVSNLAGFFMDRVEGGGNLVGYIARHPGLVSPLAPTLTDTSSFLPAITLVR